MTTATFATNSSRSVARIAVLVGSLLAGSLAVAPVVSAQEAPSIVVKYSDLDLSTTEGATTLYKRIKAAASLVCPYGNARELSFKAVGASCRADAIERAVRSIHNTELAAVHDEHTRRG